MLTARRGSTGARTGAADDAGTSLVELLVAVVVSVIVAAITLMYLLSAVGTARRSDGQNEQAAGARAVLNSWSVLVPLAVDPAGESATGAVRFYTVAPQSVKFCVGLGTKSTSPGLADVPPIGVEIALVASQLVEKRWATCAGMVAGSTHMRRILAPRASLAADGAWLLTPLRATDLPSDGAFREDPIASSLITGQQPLVATTQDGSDKIALIAGLQLSFRTLPDPRRPAPDAMYTMLLALTAGG